MGNTIGGIMMDSMVDECQKTNGKAKAPALLLH